MAFVAPWQAPISNHPNMFCDEDGTGQWEHVAPGHDFGQFPTAVKDMRTDQGCGCLKCIESGSGRCQNVVMSLDQPDDRCFMCSDAVIETMADATRGYWTGCLCQCPGCRSAFPVNIDERMSKDMWDLAEGLWKDPECARSICRGKARLPVHKLPPAPSSSSSPRLDLNDSD